VTRFMSLCDIRVRATRLFVMITFAHVPVVACVALIAGNPWLEPTAVALYVAVAAMMASRVFPDGFTLRTIIAFCLTSAPILCIYAARAHASGMAANGDWQIGYHMYFFVVLAMLAAYIDWRPIAFSATLTAVYYLAVDPIASGNVFPEAGIGRVVLLAIAVAAECAVLFWLTTEIDLLFRRLDEANELEKFTVRETAEALTREHRINEALQRELAARVAGRS
jgi:hypothetical protein